MEYGEIKANIIMRTIIFVLSSNYKACSCSETSYPIEISMYVQRLADCVGGESLNVKPQVYNGGRKIPLLVIGCTNSLHTR